MKSMRYVSCFLVGTIVAQALAQSEPLTLTIVPIGGTQVDGGQLVTAEVFLTANVAIIVSGGQVDLPCSVAANPGGSGNMVVQSITTDPDGDGLRGPSSGGIPFLHGPNGLGPANATTCLAGAVHGLGQPTNISLLAGDVRYLATYYYLVTDCARGSFTIGFECTDQSGNLCMGEPEDSNTTKFRGESLPGGPGPLLPLILPATTFTVPVGQCCNHGICVADGISESCCVAAYYSAIWTEGQTCADFCPDCFMDIHCDDGYFCNGPERCNAATGQCLPGIPPNCPNGTECRRAICDPVLNGFAGACTLQALPNGSSCGNPADGPCNDPDTCLNGSCQPNFAPDGTSCGIAAGSTCDLPDTCNSTGACQPNFAPSGTACGIAAGSTCDLPDTCNSTGVCQPNLAANGTACSDGSLCTANDGCANGSCVGQPLACNDGLFCNGTEECNPAVGCLVGPSPCSPGLTCNEDTNSCDQPGIPTVSAWGLLALALTLLAAGKIQSLNRRLIT